MKNFLIISLVSVFILSCSSKTKKDKQTSTDQKTQDLVSWNDNANKNRVLSFINGATNPNDPGFISIENRIAVFDNDGTLWTEKPIYNHVFGVFKRFEQAVELNPEILDDPVFLALDEFIKTQDKSKLAIFMKEIKEEKYNEVVGQIFGKAFEGMTVNEFSEWNTSYYKEWKHPVLKKGVRNLTYQPMKELITLLQENEFKVYIFTADEGAYLKLFSKELYNVNPENVFGSTVKLDYKEGKLYRTAEGALLGNWDNKAKLIYHITGKRPVFAAGNSNGDFHMLEYVNTSKTPHLSMLIHHTDSIREFKYDAHTDKVLPYAYKRDYLIVNMAKDWKTIFANKND